MKELNPTQVSENTCCSWIEEIIFLKYPYNSKPSMDLMQSLLKSKWNFFTYMVNINKATKDPKKRKQFLAR